MVEFTTGQFQALRATTQFHLGSIGEDISKDQVVLYDGSTLQLGDKKHNLPTIRGAVKAGWLVPVEDTTSVYRPQSAQVPVHSALNTKGSKIQLQTVHDEERDLGNLKTVRDRGDGTPKKAMSLLREDASSEGVTVGKIRTSGAAVGRTDEAVTQRGLVLTPENVHRAAQEIRRIDSTEGVSNIRAIPVRVEQESYDQMGIDVVARLPPQGSNPLGEGNSPHLTDRERSEAVEAARQARIAAATKTTPTPTQTAAEESAPADLFQRISMIRNVIPNFEWDMTRPWATRAADAVKRYGKNPLYLNGILAVETNAVKEHITKAISK